MEQTYTVKWIEKKTTSTGKEKFDATLLDAQGKEHSHVTMWCSDWPNQGNGGTVTGNLVEKQNGEYLNKTLYPAKPAPVTRGPNYGMKAAQERKAEHIAEAQDRKEEAIRHSAAQRDAVLIVTTFYGKRLSEDKIIGETELDAAIKRKIEDWRTYFINQSEDLPF